MDNEDIKNICVVCGGLLQEKETVRHIPLTVYGPGRGMSNNYTENDGFYCDQCGIKYEHLPNMMERKSYNA